MTRTLFDQPASPAVRTRKRDEGAICRRHVEKAVATMLARQPSCEHIGQVLECFADLAKQLEERMHD